MAFFGVGGVNPMATKLGQMIEKATDSNLPAEDWALNMEICDMVSQTDEGPKDAVKAIRKRLSSNSKNHAVVMYTLTVLESCVLNCGHRFHILVAQKEFLQDLVKLISPKNDPTQDVQNKVLCLIQKWAEGFRGKADLKEVGRMYLELKSKGVEFPMTDLDSMAPINTPIMKTEPNKQVAVATPVPPPAAQMMPAMQGPVTLAPQHLQKLRQELNVVQQNHRIFSEMLTELKPGSESTSDLELLNELNSTCRSMQSRIMDLIERVQNEEVTDELLRINDDLNNVFLRYDRFMRNKPIASDEMGASPAKPDDSSVDLIDLTPNSPEAISQSLADMGLNSKSAGSALKSIPQVAADDFDALAKSRNDATTAIYDAQKLDMHPGGLEAAMRAKNEEVIDTEKDFQEMEKWLEEQGASGDKVETATSSEFDKFLAERAKAVDGLPDSPKDKQDSSLFSL